MRLFTGRVLEGEEYSCNCGNYDGHHEWICNHCSAPILVHGKVQGRSVACHRVPPEDLEEGMYLLVDEHFYEILHVFDPIDEKRMYVNLRKYGSYKVSMNDYLLIQFQ